MKTKIFEKNCCLSSGETIKAHSLSYYRVWQASMDQLWGSFRSSNKYCASFKISFLGSKKWLETFFLKSYLSSRKKIFWLFFLVLSSMTNVTDSLWGFTRYTDKYCGSYRILSLAPKRLLETNFWIKGYLSSGENIEALFFSYYRVYQASVNILWGSIRSSDKNCRSYKIISLGSTRLLETKIFEKTLPFHWRRHSGPVFLVLSII